MDDGGEGGEIVAAEGEIARPEEEAEGDAGVIAEVDDDGGCVGG